MQYRVEEAAHFFFSPQGMTVLPDDRPRREDLPVLPAGFID
ncbi:hypothetical protein Pd630_LPD11058 (plasmid) [Rhodococcus opacus PD630]|nr:hypothetical protein Pd630_LPD11058 [Rhodococcus opacus PD630]